MLANLSFIHYKLVHVQFLVIITVMGLKSKSTMVYFYSDRKILLAL